MAVFDINLAQKREAVLQNNLSFRSLLQDCLFAKDTGFAGRTSFFTIQLAFLKVKN
jgi:hypothetical protein